MRKLSLQAAICCFSILLFLTSCGESESSNEPPKHQYALDSDELLWIWSLTDYYQETRLSLQDGSSITEKKTMTSAEGDMTFKSSGIIESDVRLEADIDFEYQPSGHTTTGSMINPLYFYNASWQAEGDTLTIIHEEDTLHFTALYFNDQGLKIEALRQDSVELNNGEMAGRWDLTQWTLFKK